MPAPSFRLGYTKPLTRYKFSPTAVGNARISNTQKKFGISSLYLDGTGDSVQIYDSNTALGSGDFTIECWAYYPNVSTRTNGICDFRTSGSNLVAPAIYVNTSAQIILNMNGVVRITAGGVPANSWWHFAYTRSGNQNKIFINGTQAGSTWTDSSNYTYSQFIIGSLVGGANNPALGFYDEWRMSRTARYTANFTPPTEPFENDEHTFLLLHFNDYHGSKRIEDDIGNLAPVMSRSSLLANTYGNSQISTSQFKFGSSSYKGDGTGDSIRFISDTLIIANFDFTYELNVRVNSNTVQQHFIDTRTVTTTQTTPLIYMNSSGKVIYYVDNVARITSTASLSANTWYHIALCRSGTSTKLFIEGVQEGSTYTDSNSYNLSTMTIGGYHNGTTGANSLNGYIDEVRISNTARYTANFTPPTQPFTNDDNTLLLLHFEGTDQTIGFYDDAGTRSSLPIIAVGESKISTNQAKFGTSSLYLDGTGDYILFDYTESLILKLSEWCIEMWIYAERNNTLQVLYEGVDTTNSNGPTIQITSTGALQYFTAGGIRITGIAGEITTNTWHHIAVVRTINPITTTNQHKIYLNGVQTGSTWSNSTSMDRISSHRIGALYNATSTFQGYIDEVRVSRVPRYTANFTSPSSAFTNDADTLLLLHFDEGDGSTIFRDDNT